MLRGELDWIVMKTLEKARNRRYETANGIAADLQRYLNDDPVLACPPTASYRLRKFARRYRIQVLAASLFGLALVAGIGREYRRLVRTARPEMKFLAASLHPNGRLLAAGMEDGFGFWDLSSGCELGFVPLGELFSAAVQAWGRTWGASPMNSLTL
jgi:hypothetical protein